MEDSLSSFLAHFFLSWFISHVYNDVILLVFLLIPYLVLGIGLVGRLVGWLDWIGLYVKYVCVWCVYTTTTGRQKMGCACYSAFCYFLERGFGSYGRLVTIALLVLSGILGGVIHGGLGG